MKIRKLAPFLSVLWFAVCLLFQTAVHSALGPLEKPEDVELIRYAQAELKNIFQPDKHFVLAAMRTKSGKIYTAFNLKTTATRASVCAESIALAKTIENGELDIDTLVVVAYLNGSFEPLIVSPCGICRELLYDYSPQLKIILSHNGTTFVTSVQDLLLFPYKR